MTDHSDIIDHDVVIACLPNSGGILVIKGKALMEKQIAINKPKLCRLLFLPCTMEEAMELADKYEVHGGDVQ